MKSIWAVVAAGFIALLPSAASAASATTGATGLIDIPTADVMQEGQFSLGYYSLEEGRTYTLAAYAAPRLEISAAGLDLDRGGRRAYVNVKYALTQEGILTPGIAVGIDDLGGRDERSVYAVVSKGLPLGFRVHAGVGDGRYNGVFAGLEKTLFGVNSNFFPTTTLIAEYDGKNANYGLRMAVLPGLKIQAGWRDHETYYGVSYTL